MHHRRVQRDLCRAARQMTTAILVAVMTNDLVENEIGASFMRPRGNIAERTHIAPEVRAKPLELVSARALAVVHSVASLAQAGR
jgi:hypothetical protein